MQSGSVAAALAAYAGYQAYAYPPDYFKSNLPNKIFWHNVLIGMSLHPEFARTYHLDVSDTSVLLSVRATAARDQTLDYAGIFGAPGGQSDGMVKDYRTLSPTSGA